jgi:phosphoglycolate phosphatase
LKVKAAIFDMDGTLVDSMGSIFKIINRIMGELGVKEIQEDEMGKIAGRRFSEILNEVDPTLPPHIVRESELKFIDLYNKSPHRLLPGVLHILDWLRSERIPMGIFTTAPRKVTEDLTNRLGISGYFDVIVSGDDVANPKPHPEGIVNAARTLHVKPHECVVIGDGLSDIRAGKAVHALTIGVLTGFCSEETFKKENADLVLNNLGEIPKSILTKMRS